MANGFFQIINNEQGTNLRIVPPTGGGEMFPINEVVDYLNARSIVYDLHTLSTSYNKAISDETMVELNNNAQTLKERESYLLVVSEDKMSAVMRFYAPSNDGEKMDAAEIIHDLKYRNVLFGIKEDNIEAFVQNRNYCEDVIVAEGLAPVQGKDASIEYFFSTDIHARPTLLDDGSVDFFNLNTINHCKKGDLLARLTPVVMGVAGKNVCGESLKPRDVKRMSLHYGRNISISEDKTCIYSDVNGHVVLTDDKVFVSDLLEIKDVDNSTGNIEYEGSIQINGNVCSNFSVICHGNIDVKGVVEGARLEADGDIIIARGMNGMGKGVLKAGGNIVVKFMENVDATAAGYVSAETILHSNVSAGTDITVTGKKGFIAGGRVCATSSISAKTLGSPLGADTIIEVGADPGMKNRFQKYQKDIIDARKNLVKFEAIVEGAKRRLASGGQITAEQAKFVAQSIKSKEQLSKEIIEKSKEIDDMQSMLEGKAIAQVVVTGEVYPGTKICISEVSMVVKSVCQYCRFVKSRGDVKMESI